MEDGKYRGNWIEYRGENTANFSQTYLNRLLYILLYFIFNLCGETLGTAATTGILYQPQMIGDGDCGEIDGMKIGRQGKPKYSEKTCSSVTLSTTNPTCLDRVLNPGRRGGKPTTNRLSYGAATTIYYF
jgi:hypothetical protein